MPASSARLVVLASRSPRRRALFKTFGIPFRSVHPNVPEAHHPDPVVLVTENARRKALATAARLRSGIVIGADTIVVLGRTIFGKPRDARDAKRILRRLSGRPHRVYTGVCVVDLEAHRALSDVAVSTVRMRRLSRDEIDRYVTRGSAADKAGSYGIQDLQHMIVGDIDGSLSNVIGLPLELVERLLRRCGVFGGR